MKFRINVDKVTALNAAKDEFGYKVVEVPASSFSEEQKQLLGTIANRNRYPTHPEADFYLDCLYPYDWVLRCGEATPEAVFATLDYFMQCKEKQKEKEKEQYEKKVQEWLEKPLEECIYQYVPYSLLRFPDDPRLENKKKLAEELVARKKEEKRQEEEQKRQEAERKKAILKDWAMANGSTLLKERIEGGYEWVKLADVEYGESIVNQLQLTEAPTPDGFICDSVGERTTPTLAEIQSLKKVQSLLPPEAEAKLVWVTYTYEPDEDDYYPPEDRVEDIKRAEILVTVTAPTGRELEYYYSV